MLHFSENQSHTGHKPFLFASECVPRCVASNEIIFPVFKKRKVKNVTGVQSIIDFIHISVVDLGETFSFKEKLFSLTADINPQQQKGRIDSLT